MAIIAMRRGSWEGISIIGTMSMKMLWCWRCKAKVPMLDEEEFQRVTSLLRNRSGNSSKEMFSAVLEEYERVTGYRETNGNAVFHHRLAIYGPPCSRCGKPLRTPRAKMCGSCMAPVNSKA